MIPEFKQALEEYALARADEQFMLGPRSAEWQGRGPTSAEREVLARIAQDELGHARLWYAWLAEMRGQDPARYAERSAAEVVDSALAWERAADPERPHFLWVHFYDAHAPYRALAGNPGASDRERYLGEIESIDRELGRLLAALATGPRAAQPRFVAVVGDHGESLGEHGEKEHGLLLSRAALRVPLLIAGPRVPQGRNLEQPVATRRLAATLLDLVDESGSRLDSEPKSKGPVKRVGGPPLSLVPGSVEAEPIYHETLFPFSAFGWALCWC